MSLALLPPSPSPSPSPSPRKVHLWGIFFALPAMNGPLPAEIKFRDNTGRGLSKDWKVRTNSTEGKCYSAAIIWMVITFKVSFTLHDDNACLHAPIHVYDRDVHKGACFGNYLSWIVTASVVVILLYILFFSPSWLQQPGITAALLCFHLTWTLDLTLYHRLVFHS